MDRVYWTLGEAMLLVFLVIWLFLGRLRAALIPAVTVPVCLVAAFIALYAFGFSINLLTLLALVLCIGLVVDDAIIVLENVQRRADLGEPPLVAAGAAPPRSPRRGLDHCGAGGGVPASGLHGRQQRRLFRELGGPGVRGGAVRSSRSRSRP